MTTKHWIPLTLVTLLAAAACKEDGDTNEDAGDTADSSGANTTGGTASFEFATDPPTAYTRVDRAGMPAVNTALIPMDQKDAYNQADPTDDGAMQFVPDIVASVEALHAALDDDLMGLSLTPCAADVCVMQGAPLVVPDTLQIDPAAAAGFPNGRQPTDQVIDLTLAVLLLDLSVHAVDTLAGVPVNPPANDKAFLPSFPYFAEPHTL
jgi:hypothetical protein